MVVELNGLPAGPGETVRAQPLVATSDIVIDNVAASLGVPAATVRSHLHAAPVAGTALFEVTYDDGSKLRASRVVAQAAAVLSSLVTSRFAGGSRRLTAAVTDPPRTTRVGAPWARNGLLGALVGGLVGLAWLAASALRRTTEPTTVRAVENVVPAPNLLADVRAALAFRGSEFDEAQVARWEAYLYELEAQAPNGHLPPHLEQRAAGFFAPLLKP
jgi:hypothetical protein